jgi:hypothetical protein
MRTVKLATWGNAGAMLPFPHEGRRLYLPLHVQFRQESQLRLTAQFT